MDKQLKSRKGHNYIALTNSGIVFVGESHNNPRERINDKAGVDGVREGFVCVTTNSNRQYVEALIKKEFEKYRVKNRTEYFSGREFGVSPEELFKKICEYERYLREDAPFELSYVTIICACGYRYNYEGKSSKGCAKIIIDLLNECLVCSDDQPKFEYMVFADEIIKYHNSVRSCRHRLKPLPDILAGLRLFFDEVELAGVIKRKLSSTYSVDYRIKNGYLYPVSNLKNEMKIFIVTCCARCKKLLYFIQLNKQTNRSKYHGNSKFQKQNFKSRKRINS
jgi:hypothetical protein